MTAIEPQQCPEANRAAIQGALDAAAPAGGVVALGPGTFRLPGELAVRGAALVGVGTAARPGTTLRLEGPARSVVALLGPGSRLEGLALDAARRGEHACYGAGFGRSSLAECRLSGALKDGLLAAREGNNNAVRLANCWAWFNGTAWRSGPEMPVGPVPEAQAVDLGGTVSTVAGSTALVGHGTRFTAAGARAGDLVEVGGRLYEVAVAPGSHGGHGAAPAIGGDESLTLATPAAETLDRVPYAILVGLGILQARHGDTGVWVLENCLFRGNAGGGLGLNGQYGSTTIGGIWDTHRAYAIRAGARANGDVCFGTLLLRPYFEGNLAGPIDAQFARDLVVVAPMHNEAAPLVAASSISSAHSALGGRGLAGDDQSYDLRQHYLRQDNNAQLWLVPKGGGLLDDAKHARGRNLMPSGGLAGAGTLGPGEARTLAVELPYAWVVRLSEAAKAALLVSATGEGEAGPVLAWVAGRDVARPGKMALHLGVRNLHDAPQPCAARWLVASA